MNDSLLIVSDYDQFFRMPESGKEYLILLDSTRRPLSQDFGCGIVNLLVVTDGAVDRYPYDWHDGKRTIAQIEKDIIAMKPRGKRGTP